MQSTTNLSRIINAHQAIKAERTVRRHAWEAEDAELEADQNKLKALILDHLNRTGATSIATEFGTAYRTQKLKPSAADWSAIYAWVMQDPDRFELLEKRLKATFVQQYMEENEGELPPGVNAHREFEVAVRKPSSK